MNNAVYSFLQPENEKIIQYESNSEERRKLTEELERLSNTVTDIPLIIGGKEIRTDNKSEVIMPHNHKI